MINRERYAGYARQAGRDPETELPVLSPRQYQRGRHKQFSRKTHFHVEGDRCLRCRPKPRNPAPIV